MPNLLVACSVVASVGLLALLDLGSESRIGTSILQASDALQRAWTGGDSDASAGTLFSARPDDASVVGLAQLHAAHGARRLSTNPAGVSWKPSAADVNKTVLVLAHYKEDLTWVYERQPFDFFVISKCCPELGDTPHTLSVNRGA